MKNYLYNLYNLYDLLVEKGNIEDHGVNIFCNKCEDLLQNPVLCPVGHSVCCGCIEFSTNKCQECSSSIDYKNAARDKVARSVMKYKLIFHCPNYLNSNIFDDDCYWTGYLGELEEHLNFCPLAPVSCCIPSCKFIGTETTIKIHNDQCKERHINKLLENKKLLEKIDILEQSIIRNSSGVVTNNKRKQCEEK